MHTIRRCFILPKLLLEVFNRSEIRGLDWPLQVIKIIVFKPLVGPLRGEVHCPVKSSRHPPPSSISQSSPLLHHPKFHSTALHSCFPTTSTSFFITFKPIQLHTMRLFPPPCFTVDVVVWSEMPSPHSFYTYYFPSDPILLIFVSSVYNTFFQSSLAQF